MSTPAPAPVADARVHGALLALVLGTLLVIGLDLLTSAIGAPVGLRRWFDVALENNVPTAWTVVLLLVLARRLWRHRLLGWTWRAAALAATVLAVDEWVGWHEHLRVPGEALRDRGLDLPTYAWVLPGLAVALLAMAAATPWLRSLPLDVRRRVLLAVLVFCGGALGVESVTGLVHHSGAGLDLWSALTSLEEALEMTGVLLAVSAFGTPDRTEDPPPARRSSASLTR